MNYAITAALLALASLVELAAADSPDGVHIFPLTAQRVSGYSGVRGSLLQQSSAMEHREKLYNFQNTVFYADVKIGTPPQSFKVVVDSGSFILWVPDRVCKFSSAPCKNHKTFDLHDSKSGKVVGAVKKAGKTYLKIGKIQYGTGNMQGVEAMDTVEIAGVTIPKQGLLLATTVANQPFLTAPFDGIMGIGRGIDELDGVQFNVLKNAYDQKKIKKNIISFFFSINPTDPTHAAGAITVGDVSKKFYQGKMRWHPVADLGPPMWTVPITSLSVGDGPNVCKGGCVGVIDTGTSLIISDASRVSQLIKNLGIKKDCSNYKDTPALKIVFKGNDHVYKLAGHSVSLKETDTKGDHLCAPLINTMGGMQGNQPQEVEPLIGALDEGVDQVVPEAVASPPTRRLLGSDGAAPQQQEPEQAAPGQPGANPSWDLITKMYGGRPVVIVGDLFMRYHYVAFDNTDPKKAKVGIATPKALSKEDLDQVFA
jgi:hypothetical protein